MSTQAQVTVYGASDVHFKRSIGCVGLIGLFVRVRLVICLFGSGKQSRAGGGGFLGAGYVVFCRHRHCVDGTGRSHSAIRGRHSLSTNEPRPVFKLDQQLGLHAGSNHPSGD